MKSLYLDTHVLLWLYEGALQRFSPRALHLLETTDLFISPMAVLEMRFLFEIDRINVDAPYILTYLQNTLDVQLCQIPFPRVMIQSLEIDWTRDPFDRLIVAQAIAAGGSLLTKDRTIPNHSIAALWD